MTTTLDILPRVQLYAATTAGGPKTEVLLSQLGGGGGNVDFTVTNGKLDTLGTYLDGVESKLDAVTTALGLLAKKTDTVITRTNFPTSTLTGQTLPVSSTVVALTVPGTATYAEIEVVSGATSGAAVRWSKSSNITAGPTTRSLAIGDVLKLRGAEMVAFRAIRDQATDASLHVEYGVDA